MKKRMKISRKANKRLFRRGTKTDVVNVLAHPLRGGIRL